MYVCCQLICVCTQNICEMSLELNWWHFSLDSLRTSFDARAACLICSVCDDRQTQFASADSMKCNTLNSRNDDDGCTQKAINVKLFMFYMKAQIS